MHFKLTITPECYTELKLKQWKKNNGKCLSEVVGTTGITYVFYPNGKVEVYTESSNNPHKLESEYDRSRLLTFFGQIRDRLITFLADIHERIVLYCPMTSVTLFYLIKVRSVTLDAV